MVRTLHIVVGMGGRSRHRDEQVEQVAQTAHRNGWSPEVIQLDDIDGCADEIERLVLCGGDGLLHRCLSHVADSEIDVAVVPVGTGNDFARAVGIDHHNAVAVASIAPDHADVARIDLIRAGDRYAASVVTAGYSGRVNATANEMRFPPGSAKYTIAALREIGRLSATPTVVRLDEHDTTIDGDMTLLAVGNTGWFGGGMHICPDAEPTDGLLDVVAVGAIGRLAFARWLPRVFKGSHVEHPAVTVGRAAAVTVEASEPLWADGEPLVDAPVTLTAAPGALRLLVP